MTTATQEQGLVLTEDQQVILTQKRNSWSEMGATVYKAELTFQAKAQQILSKIKIPTQLTEIAKAEATLKEVKAEFAALQAERKSITSKFDAVAERLMAPEKSGSDPIKQLQDAIINLKKIEEENTRKENLKKQKLAECEQFILETKNNAEASFKNLIIEKVNKCYNHALGAGNITPEDLNTFIEMCIPGLSEVNFKIGYPLNSFSEHIDNDTFIQMCHKHLIIDHKPYLAQYQNELRAKFSDYTIAYNNKEAALVKNQEEVKSQKEKIESEKVNANASAKIAAIGQTHDAILTSGTKALKKSFEVDMTESLQNAVFVMTAFVANIDLCSTKLKVNKWDSFTIGQMKNALSKCKSDDNAFAPQGIIFKEVAKL